MHRLQELVRLHRLGTSSRKITRLLKLGVNQERAYRQALEKAGLLEGTPEKLPDLEELKTAVLEHLPFKTPKQQLSSVDPWAERIQKLLEKGSKPKAIYDLLRLEEPEFKGSLWAVKRLSRRLKKQRKPQAEEVSITVQTGPGEIGQVDFGYVGKLHDPRTGTERKAWVFAMLLAYSRHIYARVVFDQKAETWLDLHARAFESFDGVVDTVVPDNLKAAVVRAAFGVTDEVGLNRSYVELARHYSFKVDPAPAYQPKKKGKVESLIKYLKRSFFKPREFEDLEDANRRLAVWIEQVAGQRIHGTTGKKPLEVFIAEERQSLKPLPARRFEPVIWKKAQVRHESSVMLEQWTYPVPWRYIGAEAWVRMTPRLVEVFVEDLRVGVYERGKPVPQAIWDTCLPEYRGQLRQQNRQYWQERANALGEVVGGYIQEVFQSQEVLSMLKTVQAMVLLLEKHPRQRAEAACERARYYGNYTYRGLKDILRKGLDLGDLPTAIIPSFGKLDSPRYARSAQELLQQMNSQEVCHELH